MFLRESLTEFLSAQCYADNTEMQYRRRLLALSRYEDEVHKPVYLFASSEMHEAFRHTTNNPMIAKSLKRLLESYFIWLKNIGIDSSVGNTSLKSLDHEVLKHQRSKEYFHGLPQLLAKIELDVSYAARIGRKKPSDHRMISSTFILLWLGLRIPEIVKIKKEDITKEENAVYYNDMRYEVHPRAYSILIECVNAKSYTQANCQTTSTFYYTDSEYLIRTAKSETMTENTLRVVISNFNESLPPKSSPYRADKIYWSGVFFRAYQKEIERGGFADIVNPDARMRYFGDLFKEKYTSTEQVRRRFLEYQEYSSVFRKK
jgi:hypothetical protein